MSASRTTDLRRALRVAALLAAATAPLPGARAGEPRPIAVLPAPGFDAPFAEGVLLAFERSLDEAGLTGAALARGALGADLADAALAVRDHEGGTAARSFLYKAIEEFGAGGLLILDARSAGKKVALSLVGTAAPFERFWTIDGGAPPADSAAPALRALADSAAARFGAAPPGGKRGRSFPLEADDLYARAIAAGSLDLLQEAAGEWAHDGAASALGFLLCLRGSRAKGTELLAVAGEEELGPFERRLHRARVAFAAGARAEFEAAAETLQALYPRRTETALVGGVARLRRGDFAEARPSFERVIEDRPSDPTAHLLLGETALRDGYAGAARDAYRRALTFDPHDPLARIGLASVLYSDGFIQEAAELLAAASLPDPHAPEGTRPYFLHEAARAGLLLAEGRTISAAAVLARARRDAHRLGDDESLFDLTVRRFHVFLEAGRLDSAGAELSEARFRASASSARWTAPELVPWLEGLLGAAKSDYGAVSAKRLEIESIDGSNGALPDLLEGDYYVLQGSGWEATLPLRRALRREESPFARHLLGRAHLLSEEAASAIENLEHVVDRGESLLDLPLLLPSSFYHLAVAFEGRGDVTDAELAYREFLRYRARAESRPEEISRARSFLQTRSNR